MKARRATRARRIARTAIGALVAPIAWLVVWAVMTPLPAELREGHAAESVRYEDREGGLLREVRADDATRARWVPLAEMGQPAVLAIVAAEDQRFFEHPGVDPLAVARAAGADVAHARVVSGASTLTMQLARLVRPHRKNLLGKAGEMAMALRIEASLSKRQILEQYMNRAPFGANVRGIDAASRLYFDKPPRALSLAEAAALAAIPRGPAVYSMERHPERVKRRRDRILERMRAAGVITGEEAAFAEAEPLSPRMGKGSFGAPQFVQAVQSGAFGQARAAGGVVRTTLDHDLQAEAEAAARAVVRPLAARHASAASVVVLDNATSEVLAYVGSPDWDDDAHGGKNDGVRARRQPGSTLKPFVYGLAMERLGWSPATVVPDVELHLPVASGVYAPMNYDERFHGPVRVREALASSLNVPAVYTAERIGTGPLLERLHQVGFASLDGTPDYYGPALALGDGEVTLLELAAAYATLARGGAYCPVRAVRAEDGDHDHGRALCSDAVPRDVADAVTDILSDPTARVAAFGEHSALDLAFPVAAKTGTSKGYRDNWTVGYTREVTVAVWVGNFDGSPMEGVSGITGAGPLFRAVMEAAMRGRRAALPLADLAADGWAKVEICPLSGEAPSHACPHAVTEWMPTRARASLATCGMHERVRVDRRNGLLAGRACPAAFVEERAFEVLAGPYAAWADAARRPTAPRAFSPLCPAGDGDEAPADGRDARALHVGFPHDGARFVIDPDRSAESQAIAVRVDAPAGASRVAVRVDGQLLAWTDAPFVAEWRLTPGEHVLEAEAPGWGTSPRVRVRVE